MFYLDTSVIIAALVNDDSSERASAFLWDAVNTSRVVVSDWTLTEFSSAIALKIRAGQLNSQYQAEIQQVFEGLVHETFELVCRRKTPLCPCGETYRPAKRRPGGRRRTAPGFGRGNARATRNAGPPPGGCRRSTRNPCAADLDRH
ncbi:putative nucleic-acid-binding protein [Rhizobium sp. BE258]|jgi:hypothetical protein|nr:type II toxin-antitoxin system VapC family toxin [Rhizobium sp. BE258]MDR7142697.1 putative nucleic-acid-binding protein [Rhizobium sp. BE258]